MNRKPDERPRGRKEVPANFTEFLERYPMWVYHIVRRFYHYSLTKEDEHRLENAVSVFEADVEEYVQDAFLHLMALPAVSIYRDMGFADRIQIYDGSLCPKNMTPIEHFKQYITAIIQRRLKTIMTAKGSDALGCLENQSLHDVMVVVNPVPRMQRTVLVNEVCGYISDAMENGEVAKGEDWAKLAANLGIEHTYSGRLRINNYVNRHGQHHFFHGEL